MTSLVERLCIITPDSVYAALLKSALRPRFETLAIRGFEDVHSLPDDFFPDSFLMFGSQIGPLFSSKLLVEIRHKFPTSHIFQIDGVQRPTLHMIWPRSRTPWQAMGIDASSLDLIDAAMRRLSKSAPVSGNLASKLTKRQLEALRDLASGLSNSEMASSRNTTQRAVEALIIRALGRIGHTDTLNSRKKVITAQKYLLSLGDDSFWANELSD